MIESNKSTLSAARSVMAGLATNAFDNATLVWQVTAVYQHSQD
jgi:hypothetical protein